MMGHTIDDKAAPGKTHSLTDGGGRGTGSNFWLRYFQVEIKLRPKFVLSKALVSAQISDRRRIGWQLVSHTLGCNLSFHGQSERGPLMRPAHRASTLSFQEDGCLQVEISVNRPRKEPNAQALAWSPAQHSTLIRASRDSSRDISYRMNSALSSSSEWEGAGMRRQL